MAGWFEKSRQDWLKKAKEKLLPQPPPVPQSFEVTCVCGTVVTGERLPVPQKPKCLTCGERLFVLPANLYPPPKNRKKKDVTPATAAIEETAVAPAVSDASPDSADDLEVYQEDQPQAPVIGKRNKKANTLSIGPRVSPEAKPAEVPATPETPAIPAGPTIGERVALQWQAFRAQLTRARLIFLGTVVVVAVTGLWIWGRVARDHAKANVASVAQSGFEAFRNREFEAARRKFAEAVYYLDLLGRRDVAALTIRQAYREATAANGLPLVESLEGLFEDFVADSSPQRRQKAERRVAGVWLLIDATLDGSAGQMGIEADGRGDLRTGLPVLIADRPAVVAARLAGLESLIEEGQLSPRVVFAGPIESVSIPTDESEPVVVRLSAKESFFWANYEHLEAIGYAATDDNDATETRRLLAVQRRQTGLVTAEEPGEGEE